MLDNNIKQEPVRGLLGMGGGISVYRASGGGTDYSDPSSGQSSGTGWVITLDDYNTFSSSGMQKVIDTYGGNVHVMTHWSDSGNTGYNTGRIVFNSSAVLQDESNFYHSSTAQFPSLSGSLNTPLFFGIDGSSGDYYISRQGFNQDADWCAQAFRFNSSNSDSYFKETRENNSAEVYGGQGWLDNTNLNLGANNLFVATHNSSYNPGLFKVNSSGNVAASIQFSNGSFADGVAATGSAAWLMNRTGTNGECTISKHNHSNLSHDWRWTFSNTHTRNQGGIAADSSNSDLYVAGSDTNSSPKYGILRKLNSSAVEQWGRRSGNGTDDTAFFNVEYARDGFVYALGYTMQGSSNRVGLIQKYNTSGTLQWSRRISRTGINVTAYSIAVDGSNNNNIYVYCEGGDPMIVKLPTGGSWSSPLSFGGEFELDTAVFNELSAGAATRTGALGGSETWTSYLDNCTHNANNQTLTTNLFYM